MSALPSYPKFINKKVYDRSVSHVVPGPSYERLVNKMNQVIATELNMWPEDARAILDYERRRYDIDRTPVTRWRKMRDTAYERKQIKASLYPESGRDILQGIMVICALAFLILSGAIHYFVDASILVARLMHYAH